MIRCVVTVDIGSQYDLDDVLEIVESPAGNLLFRTLRGELCLNRRRWISFERTTPYAQRPQNQLIETLFRTIEEREGRIAMLERQLSKSANRD